MTRENFRSWAESIVTVETQFLRNETGLHFAVARAASFPQCGTSRPAPDTHPSGSTAPPALAASRNGASAIVGRSRKECDDANFKGSISSSCADELRATLSDVAQPGDELYEKGCRVWNGAVHRRPAIIAFCRRPEDVQAAVRTARRHSLPLSVRGGGHDWAGRALRDGGLVIDLTGMGDVAVDPQALVATVAGGARAKDVAVAAGAHKMVAAMGNCGTVGMTGLSLGGGYGPLSGTCGLAADNVLGAEIVLADGRRMTTGPDAEPDLLWALRGGGGNFGVVTSLRVRLHPARRMLAGSVVYNWNEASAVLRRYARSRRRRPTNSAFPSARCPARTANPSSWSCRCGTANGARASAPLKTCGLSAHRYPLRSRRRPTPTCSRSSMRGWRPRTAATGHSGRARCPRSPRALPTRSSRRRPE